MSTEEPPSFDVDELRACIEDGLARYRSVLPATALRHFRHTTLFVLEIHPAARRWLEVLRPAWAARSAASLSPPVDPEMPDDVLAGIAVMLGILGDRAEQREHLAEVVVHEAEVGLQFFVDAPSPPGETPEAAERALRGFVDLALAALFAGLVGALFRRFEGGSSVDEQAQLAPSFVWVTALFARIELQGSDADTFGVYFAQRRSILLGAKRRARSLAEEQQELVGFLERLSAAVAEEGPRLEREIKADPSRLSRYSAPWASTLLAYGAHGAKPKQRS